MIWAPKMIKHKPCFLFVLGIYFDTQCFDNDHMFVNYFCHYLLSLSFPHRRFPILMSKCLTILFIFLIPLLWDKGKINFCVLYGMHKPHGKKQPYTILQNICTNYDLLLLCKIITLLLFKIAILNTALNTYESSSDMYLSQAPSNCHYSRVLTLISF